MKLQAITLHKHLIQDGIISQTIIDSFNKDLFYILPENYWNNIINGLKDNKSINKDEDIINILDILSFLINNKFHSSTSLEKITRKYTQYIKFLMLVKVIVNYDAAITKQKSRVYNLNEGSESTIILFNDDKREIIYNGDYNQDEKTEVELEILKTVKINIEKAIYVNYLASQDKINPSLSLSMRLYSIFRFMNNKKAFISKNCGRLFSSFTELSSESRKCLHDGNHNYFHELDMKNCAPVILANRMGIDGNFKKDAGSGVFYEKLQDHILSNGGDKWYYFSDKKEISFNNRKDIKKMVCASILYGTIVNKQLMSSFNNLYPEESLILNHMKHEVSNSEFANQNMRIESEIFLNLDIETKYFTAHDAIYFIGEENRELIEKKIEDKMINKFGENVKFQLEFNYNTMNDIKIKIDTTTNSTLFIFDPVNENEKIVKEYITNGITSPKKINDATGISLSTIKRIKKKLKK